MAKYDAIRMLVRRGFTEEQAEAAYEATWGQRKSSKDILQYAIENFRAPSESPYYIECGCMNPVFKSRIIGGLVLLERQGAINPTERDLMIEEIDRVPMCPRPKRDVHPQVADYVEEHFGR